MSKSGWFRFYHDLFTTRKFRRLSRDEKLLVLAAWCLASRSPERGGLLVGKGLPATVGDLADESQLSEAEVLAAIGTPEVPGSLCPCWLQWDSGTLVVHDWGEWQYDHPSDTPEAARERKRKQRERKQANGGHEVVTTMSRGSHETDSDTDSDTDTDNRPLDTVVSPPGKKLRGKRATKAPEYTQDYGRFWDVYPKERRDRKIEAFECWNARLAEGVSAEALITAATRYAAVRVAEVRAGGDLKYTMQPTTFLGPKERWKKYQEALNSQATGGQSLLAMVEGDDDE